MSIYKAKLLKVAMVVAMVVAVLGLSGVASAAQVPNRLVYSENSGAGPNYYCPSPHNSNPVKLQHRANKKNPKSCGFVRVFCKTGYTKWIKCARWNNSTFGFCGYNWGRAIWFWAC